jgi:putative addiction module component (TIGR02574 family)
VVAHDGDGVDTDSVQRVCSPENGEDQLIRPRTKPQQEPAAHGAPPGTSPRRLTRDAVGHRSAARYTEGVVTAAAKQIFEAALKLEAGERERLAEALWQSIEDQGDIDAVWAEEVKERIAAADPGEVDSTPWNEARDELQQIHPHGR